MADRDPYLLQRLAELKQAEFYAAVRRRGPAPSLTGVRHATGRLLVTIGVALAGDDRTEQAPLRPAGANR
jgi:hypothetical protein